MSKIHKKLIFILIIAISLASCKGPDGKRKFGADARKFPDDPELRVKKNLDEGRGFKIDDVFQSPKGGVFEFASSNELWRASLDVIDFMPLTSVNYSGGIIITDWYSNKKSQNESIKVTIRFLTNEVRSDALDIKIFTRECKKTLLDCSFTESNQNLVSELTREILKKATMYKRENLNKKNKKKIK